MKVLLFGSTGQLGTEIRSRSDLGELVAVSRKECDLADPEALRKVIRSCKPQIILNAAAYTAVDRAETEREVSNAINARAPRIMAEEALRTHALLVHYSTDYVFDGSKNGSYIEEDPVDPQNQYGKSKLEGELAIQGTKAQYLILRTSWVYSPYGHNFLKTMLRLGAERETLRIVDDQVGAPTSAAAIAAATERLLRDYNPQGEFPVGLYHMTAEGHVSWAGFAREIFRQASAERVPFIEPIRTEDYPTPARRPKNSRLSNEKFARTFGFRLPNWEAQLAETISALPDGGKPSSLKKQC